MAYIQVEFSGNVVLEVDDGLEQLSEEDLLAHLRRHFKRKRVQDLDIVEWDEVEGPEDDEEDEDE